MRSNFLADSLYILSLARTLSSVFECFDKISRSSPKCGNFSLSLLARCDWIKRRAFNIDKYRKCAKRKTLGLIRHVMSLTSQTLSRVRTENRARKLNYLIDNVFTFTSRHTSWIPHTSSIYDNFFLPAPLLRDSDENYINSCKSPASYPLIPLNVTFIFTLNTPKLLCNPWFVICTKQAIAVIM